MTRAIDIAITGTEQFKNNCALDALSNFYRAFNARDLAGVADNWARSEDIAMANPLGGIRRGWDAISEVYKKLFNGPAEVYVEFHDYTLHEYGDVLQAVGRERGRFQRDGIEVALAIRTSRTYRRIDGRWCQIHHHGSIDDPALLDRYQRAVRGERVYFPTQQGETS